MKISVLRHSIRNRGGDRQVLDYLAFLAEQGHSITYWTNEIDTHFSISPKITLAQIPLPGLLGTILFALFKKFDSEVIFIDLVVMAYFVSFRNKGKIFYFAQDYDLSYYRSKLLNAFINHAYHRVLKDPRIFTVCVSQGLADKLKQFDPVQVSAIPNGVSLDLFKRTPKPPKPVKTILFFARDDHRKGLDIAIAALKKLKFLHPYNDWEVASLGDLPVTIDGVPCRSLGFLETDEKLRTAFDNGDIFLVPSRSEGLSLLLLQALACECAVVSTTASSILTNEVNGLVSPIEDTEALAQNLKRVLTDAALREKLQRNARLLAQEYSSEKSCALLEKTLHAFVERRS